MLITIGNAESTALILIVLSSGGGRVINPGATSTIDFHDDAKASFYTVTTKDYEASGGPMSSMGISFDEALSPTVVNKMLARSQSGK